LSPEQRIQYIMRAMSSWSQRRKRLYISVIVVVIAVPAVFLAYHSFYTAPTCFDGLMNGTEQGIDCGGACQKLCASAFLPPRFDWARFEKVAPGLYNLAAYIENPNGGAGARNVPFHMTLYDSRGVKIADVPGTVTLPPHRNTLAFLPAVRVGENIPVATSFEFKFTSTPDWQKEADPLKNLVITDKQFVDDGAGSSLEVTLMNNNVKPIARFNVYVVLYDKDKNAVGFSKTVIDGMAGNAVTQAPFTWSNNHGGSVISQEILPVAE